MNHTPGPWYAVNYAGFWMLQAEPNYESPDILNEEKCNKAEANVILASAAPELLEALIMVNDADNDNKKDGNSGIPPAAKTTIENALRKAGLEL